MKEFDLIQRLVRDLPSNPSVVAGPGDDCALVDLGIPDRLVVLKTDAVVEGIHFTREAPPEKVGHKALARVLSDFAAAAATPVSALVTLALPADHDPRWIESVYLGLSALARRWGVAVVGGETTTCPERILISVAAVGTVDRHRTVRRSGGKPGDALFVSGELGGSIEGRHLDFEPRLAEARWLAEFTRVHAMIDLSDGLAGDLRHLLTAGGTGAELFQDSIPVSAAARRRSRAGDGAKPPVVAALTDGEDFELLFAVPSSEAVRVLDGWRQQFPHTRITCIGRLVEGAGLKLCSRHGARELTDHGYVHFA